MKKIGLLLTAFLLAVVLVKAQPGQGQQMSPEDRAKRQTEQLTTTLGLDKTQATKVEAIYLKYGKQQSELFQSMGQGGDREAMRTKMTEMRDSQNKEIKALLTKDQVEKYDKYLADQAARRGQGGPRPNN
jgi:periplasmic protein CpxP/Spy